MKCVTIVLSLSDNTRKGLTVTTYCILASLTDIWLTCMQIVVSTLDLGAFQIFADLGRELALQVVVDLLLKVIIFAFKQVITRTPKKHCRQFSEYVSPFYPGKRACLQCLEVGRDTSILNELTKNGRIASFQDCGKAVDQYTTVIIRCEAVRKFNRMESNLKVEPNHPRQSNFHSLSVYCVHSIHGSKVHRSCNFVLKMEMPSNISYELKVWADRNNVISATLKFNVTIE